MTQQTTTTRTFYAFFEHTSGGDSLLPREYRGYYDGFTVAVEADSAQAAERLAMQAMYDDREANHPDFVNRSVDDLAALLFDDPAGATPAKWDD